MKHCKSLMQRKNDERMLFLKYMLPKRMGQFEDTSRGRGALPRMIEYLALREHTVKAAV
jgi:hypothetical protein